MMRLKEGEMTVKETGEKFGLTYDQTHDFLKRQNRKKRKIEAGQASKRKADLAKREGELLQQPTHSTKNKTDPA